RHKEADELLRRAITSVDNTNDSNRVVVLTAIADNLRRWAESLERSGKRDIALQRVQQAYEAALQATALAPSDSKAHTTMQQVLLEMAQILTRVHGFEAGEPYFKEAIVEDAKRINEKKMCAWACYHLASGYYEKG